MAEEVAAALDATDRDVSIGWARLAAAAIALGLVDEPRMFRNPIVVGGGPSFLPLVTKDSPLDLIETTTFGARVIYERYGRAREESGWHRCLRRRRGAGCGRHGRYLVRRASLAWRGQQLLILVATGALDSREENRIPFLRPLEPQSTFADALGG